MGTRSLTRVKKGRSTLVTIYRQFDGYPDALGVELYNLFKHTGKIVNGYSSHDKSPDTFNGMGCVAAFLVGQMKLFKYNRTDKNPIGDVYIESNSVKDAGQDYEYIISEKNDTLQIKVIGSWSNKTLFQGDFKAFGSWLKNQNPKLELDDTKPDNVVQLKQGY
jgi:hypothetical protein